MATPKSIPMNPNHRRGIGTTLRLLDEMLCRFSEWANGREARSVLYREHNSLSAGQRARILAAVERLRGLLTEFHHDLGLQPTVQTAEADIWGGCSGFWENLVELESSHLRRYGSVPTELAVYMDTHVPALIEGLETILAVVSSESTGTAVSARNGETEPP